MLKHKKYFFIFALILITKMNFAGERKIPVDIFLMIDKSLSMAMDGKFDSLCQWIKDEFVNEILILNDNVFIYSFYENTEKLLTLTINNDNDKKKIIKAITSIKADGRYTDIGKMIDVIGEEIEKRKHDGRYKIFILMTDLIQDAPWTSPYAGKQESFKSPYLKYARIIKHDSWYEIIFDLDIIDKVNSKIKEIYPNIE